MCSKTTTMNIKALFILSLPLFLFSCFSSNAQGIYRPGFIVDNDLDTLRGLVFDGGDMGNAAECKFKVTEESKVRKYKPGEIESYYMYNYRFYKTMKSPLKKDSVVVFAEFLIDGIADIFYFRNINGNHYYVRNNRDEIIPLPEAELKKVRIKYSDTNAPAGFPEESGEKVKKDRRYIGILKYAMQDQPVLFSKINNAALSHKDLIGLAEDYHDLACTDDSECIVFSKSMPDRITGVGPVIEWNSNFLTHESENEKNNFYDLPFQEIKVGVKWFTSFPQLNRHIFLDLGLLLAFTYNTDIPGKKYTYSSYSREIIYDFNYTWLESQVNLKYVFRTEKKFKPYISAGVLFDLGLKFENKKTEVLYFFDRDEYTEIERIPPYMNKSYFGWLAGTGFLMQVGKGNYAGLHLKYAYKADRTYVNSFTTANGINMGAVYYF